jgi:hypothetical protein
LERWWVDHHQRSVTKGIGGEHAGYGRNHAYANGHGHGKGTKQATHAKSAQEDRKSVLVKSKILLIQSLLSLLDLDLGAFMESHPAYLPVSQRAKAEALAVLTWALTDRLLPSHRSIPAPFTQDEYQELRTILMSFQPGKICFRHLRCEASELPLACNI